MKVQSWNSRPFVVTVDYGRTITGMILAGTYGEVDLDINAGTFPPSRGGVVRRELYLVNLDERVHFDEVLDLLDGRGLKAEAIESLLALGETFPWLQTESSIYALGSIHVSQLSKRRSVPRLDSGQDQMRRLTLFPIECAFIEGILASRKEEA